MIKQEKGRPKESPAVKELFDYIEMGTRKRKQRIPMYVGVPMFSAIFVAFIIVFPLIMTAYGMTTVEALTFGVIADVIASIVAFTLYHVLTPNEASGVTKSQLKTQEDIQRTRDAADIMDVSALPEYTMEHVDAQSRLTRALRWQTERTDGVEWDEDNANAATALLFEDLSRLNTLLSLIRADCIVDARELRRRVEA